MEALGKNGNAPALLFSARDCITMGGKTVGYGLYKMLPGAIIAGVVTLANRYVSVV